MKGKKIHENKLSILKLKAFVEYLITNKKTFNLDFTPFEFSITRLSGWKKTTQLYYNLPTEKPVILIQNDARIYLNSCISSELFVCYKFGSSLFSNSLVLDAFNDLVSEKRKDNKHHRVSFYCDKTKRPYVLEISLIP